MSNYNFYTPPSLADALLKLLPKRKYRNIIDICCGSWNLLSSAKKNYPEAKFLGIDTDSTSEQGCFEGANFICADGRTFSLNEENRYDLVLSNPPFGLLNDEERVFKDSKNGTIKSLNNKRYENEMIQANLRLLQDDGIALFILPSTFFRGETYYQIRKDLSCSFTIKSIIELPKDTFGKSNISTCALILVNSKHGNENVVFYKAKTYNASWRINKKCEIRRSKLETGNWFADTCIQEEKNKSIKICRGNISSSDFSKQGEMVFHCSSIIKNNNWVPSIKFCNSSEKIRKAKKVFPGDIIVNRIGRFAGYWCVSTKEGYISDCLFVVKPAEKFDICKKLKEKSKKGRLKINLRGVTTNYITMNDVLNIL